jgi:hypothetical protein
MIHPCLELDGDAIEQKTWCELSPFFPHYEEFWRQHLYPLRVPGSVQIRSEVDDEFQELAANHYTAYVSLTRAQRKLPLLNEEDYLFPDEVYWHFYRTIECAGEVVRLFSEICRDCLKAAPHVNTGPLGRVEERIRPYRNLIHAPIQAVAADDANNVLIPRPEKVHLYTKWSDTLNASSHSDFVDARQQLNNDFRALSSALETAWSEMCSLSDGLSASQRYRERRGAGVKSLPVQARIKLPPSVSPGLRSGTIIISAVSASAAQVTRILTDPKKSGGPSSS